MKKEEEYKWISRTFKGESWTETKESLIKVYGFTEVEGGHFLSPNTDSVYKFVLRTCGENLFVTRIEELVGDKYTPVGFSVSDRLSTVAKHEESECEKKEYYPKLKDKILGNLEFMFPSWFASLLNEHGHIGSIKDFKSYLGMKDDEEFCTIHFLELEFEEKCGGVYCKLVKRKPNGVYRAINTPEGVYYAVPIDFTFGDLIDCIVSCRKLMSLIGFDGMLKIYGDPDW